MTRARRREREDARCARHANARAAARRCCRSSRRRSRSSASSARRSSTCRRASAPTSRTTRRPRRHDGGEPQIPLGTHRHARARRRPVLPWQVVGYVERCEVPRRRRGRAGASGANTCSTTATKASPSSSTPKTAGAGRARSPACRKAAATNVTLPGRDLPQALRLHRQGHLRARRVLLAACARRAHPQHRLRRHRCASSQAPEPRAHRQRRTRDRVVGRRDARRRCGDQGLQACPKQARGAAARRGAALRSARSPDAWGSIKGDRSSSSSSSSC